MSGEIEAAGALATAGAVAGAIEKGDPGAAGEGACLNCGTALGGGRYCSQCGQAARPHRTLVGFVGELLSSLWHFDTKAWRTLPMLLFRPGTLTYAYIHGKRARYFSPLAAFLLSIFVMFFAFSTIETPADFGTMRTQATAEELAEAREELAQARAEVDRARTSPDPDEPQGLELRLAEGALQRAEAEVARQERQLAREQERAAAAAAQQQAVANASSEGTPSTPAAPSEGGEALAPVEAADDSPNVGISVNGERVPEDSTWQEELRSAVDRGDVEVNFGNATLNERGLRSLRNPDLALYQIQDAAAKFSFLLAPLSLPFIALLFLWKRGVTLYDHMAYALYALSFAAILFSAVVLLGKLPFIGWGAGWLLFTLPVHMYFHIGGAYALGWFSALWRTFFMLIFSTIVASIFFTLVLILGLVG